MKVGVLGAGTMGAGIAQVAAQSGHEVVLVDLNEGVLEKAKSGLAGVLSRMIEKGKLSELEKISEPNDINGLEKILKLTTSVNTTNMNMFNSNRQLNKYSTLFGPIV